MPASDDLTHEICCARAISDPDVSADGNVYLLRGEAPTAACTIFPPTGKACTVTISEIRCSSTEIVQIRAPDGDMLGLCQYDLKAHLTGNDLWLAPLPPG